jgi:ATP-dependent protease ClpP protease subunit
MMSTLAARSRMWRLAIFLASALWLARSAEPAQISVSSNGGPPLITITGEFDFSDVVKFLRKTEGINDAVVILKGPGGNAVAGMQIGKAIRQKGFLTVVPSFTNCASACALAWLGGLPRFMAQDSRIGFHTAYFMKGGRPRKSTAANSLVAAYLRGLRLRRRAIAHITGAPPQRLYWLTIGAAHNLGIEAGVYTGEGITSTLDKAPPVAPR